jgi:calcium channel MID1
MYFPKLSPLQSRFAGSLVATLLLLLIYLSITNPQFAYAATSPQDFHQHRSDILRSLVGEDVLGEDVGVGSRRVPEFEGLERGIIGRAQSGVNALKNNAPEQLNIAPGDTQYWVVENSTLWGPRALRPLGVPQTRRQKRKDRFDSQDTLQEGEDGWGLDESFDVTEDLRIRQADSGGTRTLYITLNTCIQPSSNVSNNGSPPPLQLFVSTSSDNQKPGPNSTTKSQKSVPANGGFAVWTQNTTDDTYIGVSAPPGTPSFQGIYNYEIAISIDEPYHSYNEADRNLFLVDSDSNSALLISSDLGKAPTDGGLAKLKPPYVMFAHNQNDSLIQGLQNSYCGLKKYAQIAAVRDAGSTDAVSMWINTEWRRNQTREQFYIKGLNSSSAYFGYLAMLGNSTAAGEGVIGGGGKVWKSMNFATKSGKFLCIIIPETLSLTPSQMETAESSTTSHFAKRSPMPSPQIPEIPARSWLTGTTNRP